MLSTPPELPGPVVRPEGPRVPVLADTGIETMRWDLASKSIVPGTGRKICSSVDFAVPERSRAFGMAPGYRIRFSSCVIIPETHAVRLVVEPPELMPSQPVQWVHPSESVSFLVEEMIGHPLVGREFVPVLFHNDNFAEGVEVVEDEKPAEPVAVPPERIRDPTVIVIIVPRRGVICDKRRAFAVIIAADHRGVRVRSVSCSRLFLGKNSIFVGPNGQI
jgi:hypothetical protein